MLELNGKAAFVTGGGGLIGCEVCRTLARQGAAVAVADVVPEKAQAVVDSIVAAGGKAIMLPLDVTDYGDVEAKIAKTVETFGRLDISVHAAGGASRVANTKEHPVPRRPLAEQELFVFDKVLKINLYGALYVARAAARVMIPQGSGGRILSFASTVGLNGLECSVDYAAAKGGIMSMCKALAKELGRYHITVNAVVPGIVTPDTPRTTPEAHHYAFGTNFLGEQCIPADVANLTCFLASDEARFITGQSYVIDGGRVLAMKGSDGA